MDINILEKCREYLREGRLEKAQIILRRALGDTPNHPQFLELTGDLALKLGRLDEAVTRYELASENYSHNNHYAEAIISLEKSMKINRLSETTAFRLADLYRFYGLPNEGIKKIIDLCSAAMDKKDESLFISGLRKIVENQARNLWLRFSFAKLLVASNRPQDAQDEFKKVKTMAQDAGDSQLLDELNKLFNQTDGGEELDPKSRVELGNLLYEIGSKDEALVEFTKAAADLIQEGKKDEAITVLNRIVEIDPNNHDAIQKIQQLKGDTGKPATGKKPEPKPAEPEKKPAEATMPANAPEDFIQKDLDILQDLGKEIQGFSFAPEIQPEVEPEPAPPVESKPVVPAAKEVPTLEGQIADIEFLLKEAEVPSQPSFEISSQFDELRNTIVWESEDKKKKLDLARMAYQAEMYDIAYNYLRDEKDNKDLWPLSLEIIVGSLVRLGQYNDAIKIVGPTILVEDIPEKQKVELRYLLASAYEGTGDFENAMREIEHIMATDQNYRDVREIYELLGGKVQPPVSPVVPVKKPEPPPAYNYPVEEPTPLVVDTADKPEESVYPPISREQETSTEESFIPPEEPQGYRDDLISEKKISEREPLQEVPEEPKGENITFI